jgi:hypothetical protein
VIREFKGRLGSVAYVVYRGLQGTKAHKGHWVLLAIKVQGGHQVRWEIKAHKARKVLLAKKD